jgi:2-haloacid dehalogenase
VKPVKCLVFDAYGTLFDVHSIVTALDRRFPGQGAAVSEAWHTRQLESTWLRSMMDRYEDFWKFTKSALIATCNALKLPLGAEVRAELMKAYLCLNPFPDVKQALSALPGTPLAILSNGSPKMLEKAADFRRINGRGNKVASTPVMRLSGYALTARTHHRGKPHGFMRFAVYRPSRNNKGEQP